MRLIDRDMLLKLIDDTEKCHLGANELQGIIKQQPKFNSVVCDSPEIEIHNSIPHNCMNCGGKVSKQTGICLYCGTEY